MNIEYIIISVNILVFVVAPFLPNIVYTNLVETYVGTTILLVLALYCVSYGYLSSVSAFIGVASLYSESHARKARNIKGCAKTIGTNGLENLIKPASELVPNEIHPEIELPDVELIKSVPDNDNDNMFKPVESTINEKVSLTTVSNTKDAEDLYLKENLGDTELKD